MFIQKRSVTTNSVGGHRCCPSSSQCLSGGAYKRREAGLCVLTNTQSYTVVCGSAFVAWSRPRSHGGWICIVVGVASPEEIVSGHFGRVVGSPIIDMIIHLLTSIVARVVAQSFCAGRSSLYSPMSVVDIVQTACVSTV